MKSLDSEKILLIQRYLLDCDTILHQELEQKRLNVRHLDFYGLVDLIRLQAKYEALNELQRNISKILYIR